MTELQRSKLDVIPLRSRLSAPARRRARWGIGAGVAILAVAGYWIVNGWRNSSSSATLAPGGAYSVVPIDLEVKILKDGELQAVNNIDILCRVEGQTTVQTLVKEGTTVKKGEVLITLDSSAIRQKIEDTTLELQKAEADVTTARELREIQISQNTANLEAAQVALTLAKLDLQGYTDGTYPQQVAKAQADLEVAKLSLKNAQETLAQTRVLFSKGFVTAADVKTSQQGVVKAQLDLDSADNALRVLTHYTHESDLASKRNALSQAEQKLVRTERENASNLAQKNADVQAKGQALEVMKRRMERYSEQLEACTITAPADGLVVYATSGDRNAQSALQEGVQVRERQVMLRLPDTSSMKAVVRINEAQVWRLREEQRAQVRLASNPPIMATLTAISVLADNTQRWMNPDVKEYPVDLTLDYTPPGLKPGMGVKAEILVDRAEGVLAVPLSAIFTAGNDSWVFAISGEGLSPTRVRLGKTNETHAEIIDGLTANQRVRILQMGEGQLLMDQAGIRITPSTQPSGGERRGGAGPGGAARGARGGRNRPGNGPPPAQQEQNQPPVNPSTPGQAPPGAEPRGSEAPAPTANSDKQ
ncbi:MAG: HlyD family efflux transporter periplasmic adaptor subunit [Tepidisphaeraceae bacterium]